MDLRISSPCPKSWDDLVGDQRVRYCGQCRLNVYNLADMSREEVAEIIRKTEGRLCGRLYMRGDETATVENCRRSALRKRIAAGLSVAALLILGGVAWCFHTSESSNAVAYPSWVQMVFDWIGPPRKRPVLEAKMGVMVCPPTKPPTSPEGR